MRKTLLVATVLVGISLVGGAFWGVWADSTVMIKYGVVTKIQTVKQDGKAAGGAMAGGLAAAAFAGPRHKVAKIAASAAAGAAIQHAVTKGELQEYTVKLTSGEEIRISTEQQNIRLNDCVAVEKGEHANIRQVGDSHCEPPVTTKPPKHHELGATDCQVAKQQLIDANTQEEVDMATMKVRTLCDH